MAFFPLLLAAFLSVADTACIDFKLEARSGFEIESPDRLAGELRLRVPSSKEDLAPVAIAGGKACACGPAGSEVEASASVPGYWIRRETVAFGLVDSRGEAKLTLWPLGHLVGELKRPDSKPPAPREILVTTLPPRGVPRDGRSPTLLGSTRTQKGNSRESCRKTAPGSSKFKALTANSHLR